MDTNCSHLNHILVNWFDLYQYFHSANEKQVEVPIISSEKTYRKEEKRATI
jgi:hypothetical protein